MGFHQKRFKLWATKIISYVVEAGSIYVDHFDKLCSTKEVQFSFKTLGQLFLGENRENQKNEK
jgi:hypothetical protein